MSLLPTVPPPPEGVTFNHNILQSVLFNDLGFRGNRSSIFRRVYGIAYSPAYVLYDDTAKWWDISIDNPFSRLLSPELKPDIVAQKYITTTARTARQLVRIAQIVSSPIRWRKHQLKQDLMEDLNSLWDAYEEHMTCLYTFWNVEGLLTNSLMNELAKNGFQEEINTGLPSFIVPSEPNWFMLEQQNLAILKSRFSDSSEDRLDAVSYHIDVFGFLFTPFHLGVLPSGSDVAARMNQLAVNETKQCNRIQLDGMPENLARMCELVQELAFWKQERQDAFALADKYAAPMYKTLSALLEIPLNLMFTMTRDELTQAVTDKHGIDVDTLQQRSVKYCLALIDGKIKFYQPTNATALEEATAQNGDVLRGLPTSVGVVRGRVRILPMGEKNPRLGSDEIIVTSMTRPELGAALDMALAYVTDEGGMLCHAAIVSREKKKPCVVGLGNATKVLRSGMLIDVDGSAGTVTVIEANYGGSHP